MVATKIKTIYILDFNSVENHVKWLKRNRISQHDFKAFPAKVIILDFSHSRFLKPYHIAPLACLVHEYKKRGFKIKISKPSTEIQSYLESFGFIKFCSTDENPELKIPEDKKTFPLWHIEEAGKEFYAITVKDYFEKNLFSGKDMFVLGNSLGELLNNIFDHAHSKIAGYTFTQYNTRNRGIVTCVCDFGIGIPTSVNKYLTGENKPKLRNDIALEKALELSFSALTKPHNRGFGWDTVFNNIKQFQGRLLIVSNNALFLLSPNGTINMHLMNASFPGTLIVITLDTAKLPVKEEHKDELDIY
jgi:hypothetical protein